MVETNVFWKTPPLKLEQKSDSAKCSCLKILYKLYISSIEQSGYHTVATNSESYRVSMKYITALEKSEKGLKWNDWYVWSAHFYLLTLKYQHKLFVLIFLRFIFRPQRKAEDNLNIF